MKKKLANHECRNLFGAKYDLTDASISLFRINLAQKEVGEKSYSALTSSLWKSGRGENI